MGNLRDVLESGLSAADGEHPLFPGAVAVIMRNGGTVEHVATGEAVRFGVSGDDIALLPLGERVPMKPDTIFDIASLTKLFTAVTTLSLVDDGALALDQPAADFIPEWPDDARREITIRHLLTHVSGLPAVKRLWEVPAESRVEAVLATELEQSPGTRFEYSCIGYIILGFVLERLTGRTLGELIRHAVIEPLGLSDTAFRPTPDLLPRIAATEHQPYAGRGMVRGEVHDETNWSLGGVAGNAGLFSTAPDLARFGEMLRLGGQIDGVRVLRRETVEQMTVNHVPPALNPDYGYGLGPRIDQRLFMGPLADLGSFGHTGFTGTSLVVTPELGQVAVLLTNRVHPSRDWSDISEFRRDFAAWSLAITSA